MYDFYGAADPSTIAKDLRAGVVDVRFAMLNPFDMLYMPACCCPIEEVGTSSDVFGIVSRFMPSLDYDKYISRELSFSVVDAGVRNLPATFLKWMEQAIKTNEPEQPAAKRPRLGDGADGATDANAMIV